MRFVWDENKRLANIAKHILDFADSEEVYFASDKVTINMRRNDEDRFLDLALLKLNGRIVSLVYVQRQVDEIRIISFRQASKQERKLYEKEKSN